MATYHLHTKTGVRGKGAPALAHAEYVLREGKYATRKDKEVAWSGNMPSWAEKDSAAFWQSSDNYERANGRTYREIEFALPRELNEEQRRRLVSDFIQETIGSNHAYTVAIHCPKASIEGGEQPHAHLIFSERRAVEQEPELYFSRKGAGKDESWKSKDKLLSLRESWAKTANMALAAANQSDRIDHRSYRARGIDQRPEPHLGYFLSKKTAAADHVLKMRRDRRRLIEIEKELAELEREAKAQDVVVPVPPPKNELVPTPEIKIDKKQEVEVTPDATRLTDLRPPLGNVPTPISSESVFVPPAQSDSVTPLPAKESNYPIQQPALPVEPKAKTNEALNAVLRRIAKISQIFVYLYKSWAAGDLLGGDQGYNERTDKLEKELDEIIKPFPEIEIFPLPYDDTPIIVNGEPITDIVLRLPPEPIQAPGVKPPQEPKPVQAKSVKR